jgi:LysM repeat protein
MLRFSRFGSRVRRASLLMMLVFTLVLAALPAAVFAAPASSDYGHSCGGTCYVVQKGDTLSHIAKRFGVSYHELARYNGIANPSVIYVGQVIRIPAGHHGGHHGGHDKDHGCGGCDYDKGHDKDHGCGGCDYDKGHDKDHGCGDCGGHKGHKDHGCGSCGGSYHSYSGYAYGSHLEAYTLIDEYSFGHSYSGYEYHKK